MYIGKLGCTQTIRIKTLEVNPEIGREKNIGPNEIGVDLARRN
jgi:hypothetical protein